MRRRSHRCRLGLRRIRLGYDREAGDIFTILRKFCGALHFYRFTPKPAHFYATPTSGTCMKSQAGRFITRQVVSSPAKAFKSCKKVVTNGSNVCVRDVATKPPEKKTVTARARGP